MSKAASSSTKRHNVVERGLGLRRDTRTHSIIFTIRCHGKNWRHNVALICALYTSVKGIVINIVTNNKRTAGGDMGLLDLCKVNLQQYVHMSKYKISNSEHLVTTFAPDDIRRISSFSANSGDGLRGLGLPNPDIVAA